MKHRSFIQRIVLFVPSLFLLFTPGCKTLEKIAGSVKRPTASISGIHLSDLSMDAVTLLFDVDVTNPYGVPLPMVNVDYSLASSDQQFLTGQADIQDTVPANGTKTVSLPAQVSFLETLRVLRQFKPGTVIPYKADLGLSVNAPGVGPLRLPLIPAPLPA